MRRLIDQDPRRELRRQNMLRERLEISFRNKIKAELRRASVDMAVFFDQTGDVSVPPGHADRLTLIYQAMAIATFNAFGARVMMQGKGSGIALETKGFAETMTRFALQYIAGEAMRRRITDVADTTRGFIMRAVRQGYEDGLGQRGVAQYILDLVPSFTDARAGLIARTETHGAANAGANEAAKETGLNLRKEWISADDERTREDHSLANGQIVGQDEAFDIGGEALMFPGDPAGSGGQVINCRCSLGWVVDD